MLRYYDAMFDRKMHSDHMIIRDCDFPTCLAATSSLLASSSLAFCVGSMNRHSNITNMIQIYLFIVKCDLDKGLNALSIDNFVEFFSIPLSTPVNKFRYDWGRILAWEDFCAATIIQVLLFIYPLSWSKVLNMCIIFTLCVIILEFPVDLSMNIL